MWKLEKKGLKQFIYRNQAREWLAQPNYMQRPCLSLVQFVWREILCCANVLTRRGRPGCRNSIGEKFCQVFLNCCGTIDWNHVRCDSIGNWYAWRPMNFLIYIYIYIASVLYQFGSVNVCPNTDTHALCVYGQTELPSPPLAPVCLYCGYRDYSTHTWQLMARDFFPLLSLVYPAIHTHTHQRARNYSNHDIFLSNVKL